MITSINPATGQKIWQGKAADIEAIDTAIFKAKEAFALWSNVDFKRRCDIIKEFHSLLKSRQETIVEAISLETGKPLWESKNEVLAMINKVDISIEACQQRYIPLEKETANAHSITRYKPHGIAAVFGPFNFPGHLPNGHIIPALLAGNVVLFKPSEYTPLVAEVIYNSWQETSLPKNVIQLLQGGQETGKILASHKDIDALFFTGSASTGIKLAESFAATPEKILALEMGGNNPLIIGDIGNPASAAYLTVQSAYLTSGQRCTCARRLIVIDKDRQKSKIYIDALKNMIEGLVVGPYTQQPEPFMGPVISHKTAQKLLEVQSTLKNRGGKILLEMRMITEGTGLITPGLMDVTDVASRPDEEYFGPFLQLIYVSTLEEALIEANNTAYGLAAGLLSDNKEEYNTFYRQIKAGVVNWNVALTGASSAAPFGGIGKSGNHRPSAYFAADYCAYPVASMESGTIQMPTTFSPGIKRDNYGNA